MVADGFSFEFNFTLIVDVANEFNRDDCFSLVEELEEAVLTIGAGFTEIDWPCGEGDFLSINGDTLSVGLHIDLLYVAGKLS